MLHQALLDSIIEFWFSDEFSKHWFNSTPALDCEIKSQFESTYILAIAGTLQHWQTSPSGCLALILLFDQIPLNMYRGQRECFAAESQSRDVASIAILKEFDKNLSDPEKKFVYMPYMHSEDITDQVKAIDLFSKAGLTENLKFARHHHDIVNRFGRFPHRNKILGRLNTAEEEEYLNSDQAFHG